MSNGALVTPLTVRRDGPSSGVDLSRSKVMYFNENDLQQIYRTSTRQGLRAGAAVKLGKSTRRGGTGRYKVETHESPQEIRAALIALTGGNTDFYAEPLIGAITAAGSVLTAATAAQIPVGKYLTRITAATVNSNDAVMLPAPSGGRFLAVLVNAATCPIRVFPHTASAFIDSGASGAQKTLAIGQRLHFYTPAISTGGNTAIWKTGLDTNNVS